MPVTSPPSDSAAALAVRVVTGLSGSGKSTALRVLEDLGWYCVDNLPTLLVANLVGICAARSGVRGVALGIDAREKSFLSFFPQAVADLRAAGHRVEIVFLDARDEALLRRFSSTRRPHPLSPEGEVLEGVRREREELAPVRAIADRVLDTSDLTVHELRRRIIDHLTRGAEPAGRLVVRVVSFGYKFGVPIDADVVLDVRFLPNPYFVDNLRALPGTDPGVAAFVTGGAEAAWFLDTVAGMFERLLPHYVRDGRTYLVGCEPSCLLTLRDEYLHLAPALHEQARVVADRTLLIDEFLAMLEEKGELELKFKTAEHPRPILFHGHCHQKAFADAKKALGLLRTAGYSADMVNAACCGMAGAHGYEREHYEPSREAGERALFPALRAHPDADVVIMGVSCRQQIEHFMGRPVKHLVEALLERVV